MLRRPEQARWFGRTFGLLTLAPLAFASPASAQVKPQAHLAKEYAGCVVARQRTVASQFVLDRTTLALDRKYASLRDSDCPAGSNADGAGMRFALAEALLRDEINAIDPARLPRAARLETPLLRAADYEPRPNVQYSQDEFNALGEQRGRDQMNLIMYRFGDCTVRTDPAGSRALLVAPEGSAAEGAAFQSLMPTFAACLEKGAQLKFDRPVLRGAIAFGYYSLAHAPAATQTANAQR